MKSYKKKSAIVDNGGVHIPYVVKEGGLELALAGRYVCVYMRDKAGKDTYLYGSKHIFNSYFRKNIKNNDIHQYACEMAFTGKKVSYDWFVDNTIPTFFNTINIPLSDSKGKITALLCIIKALDELLVKNNNNDMVVAEKAGQSFVRIIMQAREEEKRIITSAIHDQLGNFSIRTNALIELLKEDITSKSKKEALRTLTGLQDAVQESILSMKEIITSLRPLQLDSVGLNASLKELLDKISSTETIKIKYSYKIDKHTLLAKNIQLILYRVVQEALSNTVKYANATIFTVELKEDRSALYLTVKDNGKGFIPQVHRSAKSLGLAGMKENIESLKGTMKLKTKLGEGTSIYVKCPKFNYSR